MLRTATLPVHRLALRIGAAPASVRLHSTAAGAPTVDHARTYCAGLLREQDYASHLLTVFFPPSVRDAHLAIRALNVSIATIDDTVSRAELGQARMVFWQDLLTRIYQEPTKAVPAEPVAVLLAKVLREDGIKIGEGWFRRLIKARKQYLGGVPFSTLDDLESYAENTYSSLHYATLEALNYHSTTLDHIGSHIGKATGIANILRGIPVLSRRPGAASTVVLPLDVCAQNNLRQEDVLRMGPEAPGLKDAVFQVATRANDHIITARKMLEDAGVEAKGTAFASFLPAIPTVMYLEKLEKADFDPFSPELQKKAWTLPWRAYRASSSRKL